MSLIHELILLVMDEVGAIAKTHWHGGYKARTRSVEDVPDALQPALKKHGVILETEITDHRTETILEPPKASLPGQSKDMAGGGRTIFRASVTMRVTFRAADGSSVACMASGEGIGFCDDTATSKAMSKAYKYAILFGLCVPFTASMVEDSDRGENATPPAKLQPTAPKPATQPPPKPLDRTAESYAKHSAGDGDLCVTEQQRRIGDLCKALGIDGHGLKAILQKRKTATGSPVQTLEQLTIGQAGEIIAKLQEVCTRKQVPF